MKTTLDLPDELLRSIKLRAVREDRKLKDLIADLLRRGLAVGPGQAEASSRRVQLPLIQCAHPAQPDEEATPGRVAELLLDDEAQRAPRR